MRRFLVGGAALALAGAVASVPWIGSAQSAATWPTFHGNGSRTGVSSVSGQASNTAANQWTLPKPIHSSPVIDANGTAYIGDDDGYVYALNPATPTTWKWRTATFPNGANPKLVGIRGAPSLSQDGSTLFVGSNTGVYALKTADGTVLWGPIDVGGAVTGSPLVSPDGSQVYIATLNGTIYTLNASNGTVVGKPLTVNAGSINGSLTLSADGTQVYAATTSGIMYGVGVSGSNAGKVTTEYFLDGPSYSTPAVDSNGNIYITTNQGSLLAFTPNTAAPKWQFTVPSGQPASSSPAIDNGIVVFGDVDQNVYAVNTSNQQQVWFKHTGGPVESSPAIAGGNGVVYVGADDGIFWQYDLATGNSGPVFQKNAGAAIVSSPAIAQDGSVWFGSESGDVYRLHSVSPPGTPVVASVTAQPSPTTSPTLGPAPTATATSPAPTPSPTTGPTITLKLSAKSNVAAGKRQSISVTAPPKTVVHLRVTYPNGDHQSHKVTVGAKGKATYSYTQGASKIKHNRFYATISAKAGSGATAVTATKKYKIGFGRIDVSVEPRKQAIGKVIDVWIHTNAKTRVVAYLLFPTGKFQRLYGRTGSHGWAHLKYKVGRGLTKGKNHKVKVLAKWQYGHPTYSSSTFFTIK